jgi:cold-inducible RNA-binding protein
LGERSVRNAEAVGSNPIVSTITGSIIKKIHLSLRRMVRDGRCQPMSNGVPTHFLTMVCVRGKKVTWWIEKDCSMNIYVGNISYSTNETMLEQAFSAYGTVDSARIITDRDSGRSKGFGFVEMADQSEAQAAIEALNGTDIDGRSITVNEARPKPAGGGGGNRRRF